MWSVCKPKNEDTFTECAAMGKNLNRLMQPATLAVLQASDEPIHGYVIAQRLADSPMFGGSKPDAAGLYRTLHQMEEAGLVASAWDTSSQGPAKRRFDITEEGKAALVRWIDTLACYSAAIQELRGMACESLGIEVPPTPVCGGH